MNQFLGIKIEEIPGDPPIALFTLETNIKTVQLKLDQTQQLADSTIKNKIIRTLETISGRNGKPTLTIENDGRITYSDPACPNCHSKDLKKNGTQKRTLKGFFNTVLETRLQKYRCNDCRQPFKVNLSHIVNNYGHYTNDLREQAVGYSGGRALSLGESTELLQEVSGVKVSRETIRQWKNVKGKLIQTILDTKDFKWSGIYSYDEQFIKIKGQLWYRCLLYDAILDRPVNDLIVPQRDEEQIIKFLKASLNDKPLSTFIVDSSWYLPILQREFPEASIQLCVVHAMRLAKRDFHEAAGQSPISKQDLPSELEKLLGKLWNVFLNSKTLEEAEEHFHKLYLDRFHYSVKVRQRLELMADVFVYLTEYLVNPEVPRTNNPSESYFNRTCPARIKKKFQTPEGFQAQIMCLDGWKGGLLDFVPVCHKTLEQIYYAFGELIAMTKT